MKAAAKIAAEWAEGGIRGGDLVLLNGKNACYQAFYE